jgi:hypothetical protein
MARIFISHSSANNAEAIALRDWLAGEGWDDVFLDLDPERGIVAGERWERAFKEAESRCEAVLFLLSRAWLNSRWCQEELNLAHRLNKRPFGVLVEDMPIADLPPDLTSTWQLVSLATGSDHRRFRALTPDKAVKTHVKFSASGLSRLKGGLTKAGLDARFFAWPPAGEPNRPPYRGLKPLEAEDAGIFFGREAQIIAALDGIRGLAERTPPRFFVILGASGAGKSSFLRAGLLPRLSRDDRNFLPLPAIRPDRAVLSGKTGLVRSLDAAFQKHKAHLARAKMKAPPALAKIKVAVEGGAQTLLPLLCSLAEGVRPPSLPEMTAPKLPALVMSIDQGEELFVAEGAKQAEEFLSLLKVIAMAEEPKIIVLVTIRSDSYERLQMSKALEGVDQKTLSLPPVPHGSYVDIIEGPARRLKDTERALKIEPALTEALLTDIEAGGAKDALPLLAFTLEWLYLKYGGDGDLRLSEYEQLGRIKGSIEAAVKRALAAADAADHATRLALLRRGLIPWLAEIDPDTGVARRRVARITEIPEKSRPLINLLVEQRLLTTDTTRGAGSEVTVEPAHEALLRQWEQLNEWLRQGFTALKALESVKRAARDWEKRQFGHLWSEERIIDFVRQFENSGLSFNDVDDPDQIRRFLGPTDPTELVNLLSFSGEQIELEKMGVSYGQTWQPPLSHRARRSIGVRLALLGDPKAGDGRRGTGLGTDGRPDIDWCKIESDDHIVVKILSDTDDPDSEVKETISRRVETFFISKYPITIAQFRGFVDECYHNGKFNRKELKPSSFPPMLGPPDHEGHHSNEPAFSISWYDAVTFCNWITERFGHKVRLPTEFEWQLASTGRNQLRIYPWDNVESKPWDPKRETWRANTTQSGLIGATAVGLYPKGTSPFGVLDMAGTVWEWCLNSFDSPEAEDFDEPGVKRAWRGGSWYYNAEYARCTYRYWNYPDARNCDVGFRIVTESVA